MVLCGGDFLSVALMGLALSLPLPVLCDMGILARFVSAVCYYSVSKTQQIGRLLASRIMGVYVLLPEIWKDMVALTVSFTCLLLSTHAMDCKFSR